MTRTRLPNRRPGEAVVFDHGGMLYTGHISFAVDSGRVTEAFLDGGKAGTAVQAMARDAAVLASLALQHGAPIEVLRHAMTRNDDGSAAGPMGALLDLVAEGT